jgi:hypothetical protein
MHACQADACNGSLYRLAACVALAQGHYPAPPSGDEIEVSQILGARIDPKTQWRKERLQLSRAIYKRLNFMKMQDAFEFIDRIMRDMSMMMGVEEVVPDAVVCPIY